MISIKSLAFAKYLNASTSLNWINANHKIDLVEEQLLNHILLMTFKGDDLLVGDLLVLWQFGSQATIHKRLKSLSTKGYVELREGKLDGRKKLIYLTAKADKHFQKLSVYLNKALKEIINPISPKANI